MWQPRVMQANGDIYPRRFVKLDTSVNNAVIQAGAGDLCFGISQAGTQDAPIPLNTSLLAASQYNDIQVFTPMQTCLLTLGASVTTERRLKSDSNGKGTPVVGGASSMENWGAVALEVGSSGEDVMVMVVGPMTVAHPGSLSGFN